MINPQVTKYIQEAREKNISDVQIINTLKNAGWSDEEINQSKSVVDVNLPIPPIKPGSTINQSFTNGTSTVDTPNGHTTMWDAFEHILLFISLIVMSVSLGLIMHYFVDKWVPAYESKYGMYEDYSYYHAYNPYESMLRGYLAGLIVSFPLFSFLFIRIAKRTKQFPYLRNLRAREAVIYLTLIITFVTMLVSVISIVYGFLEGNTTFNFFLHFLVTTGISGVIFAYYLHEVREDRKNHA